MTRAPKPSLKSALLPRDEGEGGWSTLITGSELARHLDDPRFVIVDVRHDLAQPEQFGEEAYAKSHIPGAAFAHVDRDLSATKTGRNGRHPLPTPEATSELFGRLGIDATKQVVTYDQGNGMYAARLWWMLRWLGHDAAAVLDGGFARWLEERRPVTSQAPRVGRTTFVPSKVRPTVNATGIAASLPRHALLLLDARAAERYRGDVEPLDPVAGHIPGALNRPFAQNIAADGRFKPREALRAEFDALLAGRDPASVVHQCGSGVSAVPNLVAMELAGYAPTALYAGSWSEWSRTPGLPVEKG